MKLFTYQYKDTEVVSEIEIVKTKNEIVIFKDGSAADLKNHVINNKGNSSIFFRFFPFYVLPDQLSKKELTFESCQALQIIAQNEHLYFEIQETTEDNSIEIIGNDDFVNHVDVQFINNKLSIILQGNQDTSFMVHNTVMYVNGERIQEEESIPGKIVIKLNRLLPSFYLDMNYKGYGILSSPIDEINLNLRGSAILECSKVNIADVKIEGSSDVTIQYLTHTGYFLINGSGSVNVLGGELQGLDVQINGSGNVFANVVAKMGNLAINGSGDIFLAHVLEETKEVHRGSGHIYVLKREGLSDGK